MLYIRVDGNTNIGMGHVMRCLSVAEAAYLSFGQKPLFILADESCRKMVEDRGFSVHVLGTDFQRMEAETELLRPLLTREDMLLVDSYQVTEDYFLMLREICNVACLEDMGIPYPADILINYNIYGEGLREQYRGNDKLLLGPAYMPLRESFRHDVEYQVREQVRHIMITTGGSDPCFAAGAMTDALLAEPSIAQKTMFHVVSGPFNHFRDTLAERYQGKKNVMIHENVKDMKELLKACDVIVTATGSTIYEVSTIGVPMVCFYFAENQRQGAEALEKLTEVVNCGCFAADGEQVVNRMVAAVKRCMEDKAYRELLFEQERRLVDGKGALRIAEELLKYKRNAKKETV